MFGWIKHISNSDWAQVITTIIKAESNRVVQIRTMEVDGYNAVQVTTGAKVNNTIRLNFNNTYRSWRTIVRQDTRHSYF